MSEPTGITTKELSKASTGFKVSLFGVAGAAITGAVTALVEACPSVVTLWPTFLTAGLVAGLGFYLKSPKQK